MYLGIRTLFDGSKCDKKNKIWNDKTIFITNFASVMDTKARFIVGRKNELETLKEALFSDESQFIAVYGRRRVGKTFLIKRAFDGDFSFQYTGLEKKSNKQQLDAFHLALRQQGLPKCAKPTNWIEAFYQLQNLLENKKGDSRNNNKKVVFLDELPWMDAPKAGFVEALGNFWNRWAAWTQDVFLVICGSATSWMFNKVFRNHGGLYNRVTRQIPVKPFSLSECEQLSDRLGLGWTRMQIAEAYMIMGGIPHYWNKFDRKKSLVSNIDRLFFCEDADMTMEYKALYSSLFSNPEPYEDIIEALSQKKRGLTRQEISDLSGYDSSGRLTSILENLELCGFIVKINQPNKKNKDAIFQLVDNFSLFYHEFIRNKGERLNYWCSNHMSPAHSAWRGLAFERLCFQHRIQIAKALGISGIYAGWYAWTAPKTDEYPGMQVDMVIDRADNMVNLCEIKFTEEPFAITPEYMQRLRLRRGRYQQEIAPKKGVHLTMITSAGVVQNPQKFEINSFVSLDDLFAE